MPACRQGILEERKFTFPFSNMQTLKQKEHQHIFKMSNYKDFKEFYETKLLPDLKILDSERKQVDRRVIIIVVIAFALIIAEGTLIPSGAGKFTGILQVTTGVFGFILVGLVSKKFRLGFKNKIISKITGFVDESLAYLPEGSIPRSEFLKSAIFRHSCDDFKGEDHIHGTIDKTAIEFSEVVAKYRTSSGSGSNQKQKYTTYFKGIFFIADFNKHFKTQTLVLPDTAEKLFGKFGQKLQSMSFSRGKLVKLEDPEFEKEFCVYGDDQVEARYILSTSLMRRILEFKKKWDTKIYLSFVDSKVYIAISLNKNLFETRLFKTIIDYSFIEENVKYLILLIGIVEDLNLNTRIWTKQ